jgi:2-amino-4-hydroxy-6-hydroxymethyldihydropteridine diphosphokinase/dihydropteroate synthase
MASLQPNWRHPISGGLTLAEILHSQPPATESYKSFMPFPQMVGIVNITPDSFSDGGKYLHAEKAIQHIQELTRDGAAVIDLGAQSTRPGAQLVSAEEEWQRLEPVLDLLHHSFQNHFAPPQISLDSFYPEVIEKALQKIQLAWINDVQGGKNERLIEVAASSKCKIVLTHSLTVPASKTTVLPFNIDPISPVCEWADKTINKLQTLGISKDRIILDPGIGFGKSPYQSLQLLRNIDELKAFGCEIFVGHSRKSFLNIVTKASDRDLETIGVSHYLAEKGIDYLRVHNVEAHQRCLTARGWVEGLQGDA